MLSNLTSASVTLRLEEETEPLVSPGVLCSHSVTHQQLTLTEISLDRRNRILVTDSVICKVDLSELFTENNLYGKFSVFPSYE